MYFKFSPFFAQLASYFLKFIFAPSCFSSYSCPVGEHLPPQKMTPAPPVFTNLCTSASSSFFPSPATFFSLHFALQAFSASCSLPASPLALYSLPQTFFFFFFPLSPGPSESPAAHIFAVNKKFPPAPAGVVRAGRRQSPMGTFPCSGYGADVGKGSPGCSQFLTLFLQESLERARFCLKVKWKSFGL